MEKAAALGSLRKVTPFLVSLSVRRADGPVLPGRYSPTMQVWVVDGEQGPEPLVSSALPILELATKTKVERERDDHHSIAVLPAITKTAVESEQDDDEVGRTRYAPLPELATKTEVVRERDD